MRSNGGVTLNVLIPRRRRLPPGAAALPSADLRSNVGRPGFEPGARALDEAVRFDDNEASATTRGGAMNAEDLRTLQAPLKERYRERPDAALITLKAQGRLGEGVTCSVQTGKAVVAAVEAGFGKAFLTIIDTHVTTIVSCCFLFLFGTGPVKGFAVTLVIGLFANVFTAVFVSRTIFNWELGGQKRAVTLSI